MARTRGQGLESQEVYRVSATEERRFEILRAIVEDYVATQEPIGSKAVSYTHLTLPTNREV